MLASQKGLRYCWWQSIDHRYYCNVRYHRQCWRYRRACVTAGVSPLTTGTNVMWDITDNAGVTEGPALLLVTVHWPQVLPYYCNVRYHRRCWRYRRACVTVGRCFQTGLRPPAAAEDRAHLWAGDDAADTATRVGRRAGQVEAQGRHADTTLSQVVVTYPPQHCHCMTAQNI